jgi:hypothetical protein
VSVVSRTTRTRRAAEHPGPPSIVPGRWRTRARRGPADLLLGGLLLGGLLLGGLLLGGLLAAGCGSPAPAATAVNGAPTGLPSAVPSSARAAMPTPDPAPSLSAAGERAEPVRLPWPAADAAAAAELQRSVDGGSEPWLLDPAEVAVSYASAAHGWVRAEAQPRPDGSTVDVSDGGRRLTLSLAQPGRTGAGGIWVVTGETAG